MTFITTSSTVGKLQVKSVVVITVIILGAVAILLLAFGTTYLVGRRGGTTSVNSPQPSAASRTVPVAINAQCDRYLSIAAALTAPDPKKVCVIIESESLSVIPAEIRKFENLQTLMLAGPRHTIKTLPAELGELKKLETLMINFTEITTVPSQLGQATSLKVLILNNNQITSLPRELAQLQNLQTLSLGGNPLSPQTQTAIQQSLPKIRVQF